MSDEAQGERGPTASEAKTASELLANDKGLERFARIFEESAKRWELVVYPSLIAFIVLAVYGFYLIYSLTSDVASLAKSIDPRMEHHMAAMTVSIERLADTVAVMQASVAAMDSHIEGMSGSVANLEPMLKNMEEMNRTTAAIAASTSQMGRDLAIMNSTVSPAMHNMNKFMPWQ